MSRVDEVIHALGALGYRDLQPIDLAAFLLTNDFYTFQTSVNLFSAG
jgi:hypothetical protein